MTKPGDEVAVKFYRMQMPGAAGEGVRYCTLARPNFNDYVVLGRVDCTNDGVDNARIIQEMLAKALACAVLRHQLCAMVIASSTAASRLPGSALPVPAISNAVPWSTEVRMIGRPSVTLTA